MEVKGLLLPFRPVFLTSKGFSVVASLSCPTDPYLAGSRSRIVRGNGVEPLLLQSEQGIVRAFLTLSGERETRVPGLYERIFALLLILHFGRPRYGFIEEYVLLPDIL